MSPCSPQAEKDSGEPYFCLSDFVAPKGSGVSDYVGMFACSAGHGLEEVIHRYKEVGVGWVRAVGGLRAQGSWGLGWGGMNWGCGLAQPLVACSPDMLWRGLFSYRPTRLASQALKMQD